MIPIPSSLPQVQATTKGEQLEHGNCADQQWMQSKKEESMQSQVVLAKETMPWNQSHYHLSDTTAPPASYFACTSSCTSLSSSSLMDDDSISSSTSSMSYSVYSEMRPGSGSSAGPPLLQEVEVDTTMSQLHCQSKKKVSFYSSVQVHEIRPLADFTEDEKEEVWLRSYDYQRIKRENRQIVSRFENQPSTSPKQKQSQDDVLMRGLECFTKTGSHTRRDVCYQSLYAVLQEQCVQYHEGVKDEYLLSNVYKKVAYTSKMKAYLRGVADAKEQAEQAKEEDESIMEC